MNVHANILCLVHNGAPFGRWRCGTIKTYRKVGAFYIAWEEEWLLKKSVFPKKVKNRVIENVQETRENRL
jgi:hypothetical protein